MAKRALRVCSLAQCGAPHSLLFPRLMRIEATHFLARSATRTAGAPRLGGQQHLRPPATGPLGAGRLAPSRGFAAEAPSRSSNEGPVSWASLTLALLTGGGIVWYFNRERSRIKAAALGGPFRLVNQDGKEVTEQSLHGSFALLYFGFTHCPDICPEELVKVASAIDAVEKQTGHKVVPVFISIDPERDNVAMVKSYVKEFHPRMVGLTGTVEACAAAAKAFRVYYHKTAEEDYLVDHSIITYLLDPAGKFVAYYGKNVTAADLAAAISGHVESWVAQQQQQQQRPPLAPTGAAPPQS